MKTLKEYNDEHLQLIDENTLLTTGIQCTECDGEFIRESNGIALACYPPKYKVACNKCGNYDYIY